MPFVALLLLFVTFSRMVHISEFDLDTHENYAVAQANGSLEEIVRWTPYDWGAASFVALGVWQTLVGSDPIALRFLSVLLFVWASAVTYTVMRMLAGRQFAPLALLVYAAPIMLVLLSLFARGYAFLIALLPTSLFLALLYERRPRLIVGIALALSLALLVYVHVTGVFAVVSLGLFMVARGGRSSIRRWLLPGMRLHSARHP